MNLTTLRYELNICMLHRWISYSEILLHLFLCYFVTRLLVMRSSITTRYHLNSLPLCSLLGIGGVEFLVPATGRFQPDKQSGRFEMNYRHRHEWRRQRRSSVGDLLWRRNGVCVRNNSRGRKPELLCVLIIYWHRPDVSHAAHNQQVF